MVEVERQLLKFLKMAKARQSSSRRAPSRAWAPKLKCKPTATKLKHQRVEVTKPTETKLMHKQVQVAKPSATKVKHQARVAQAIAAGRAFKLRVRAWVRAKVAQAIKRYRNKAMAEAERKAVEDSAKPPNPNAAPSSSGSSWRKKVYVVYRTRPHTPPAYTNAPPGSLQVGIFYSNGTAIAILLQAPPRRHKRSDLSYLTIIKESIMWLDNPRGSSMYGGCIINMY
jgi:hypothetical protein